MILENVFSSGHLFYRRLLLDAQSASLYAGANGHLFKLWAYNINDTTTDNLYAHAELSVSRADADECRQNGHEECVNGVRLMFLKEGRQTLLVCSSNAMKPQLRELDAVTLRERSSPENVIGVCSPDPNLNTTATLVGNLSHFSHIYALY
uniref:Sema domain-containing protein n=1 Tax=Parascaris equorum TaxID=6256 RepID=A0A914R3Q7_PAREQ